MYGYAGRRAQTYEPFSFIMLGHHNSGCPCIISAHAMPSVWTVSSVHQCPSCMTSLKTNNSKKRIFMFIEMYANKPISKSHTWYISCCYYNIIGVLRGGQGGLAPPPPPKIG